MRTPSVPYPQDLFVDKDRLRQALVELDAKTGFVPDPDATPEKSQELMRAEGIRAKDNLFSRDIIRSRYPDEFAEDEK